MILILTLKVFMIYECQRFLASNMKVKLDPKGKLLPKLNSLCLLTKTKIKGKKLEHSRKDITLQNSKFITTLCISESKGNLIKSNIWLKIKNRWSLIFILVSVLFLYFLYLRPKIYCMFLKQNMKKTVEMLHDPYYTNLKVLIMLFLQGRRTIGFFTSVKSTEGRSSISSEGAIISVQMHVLYTA